MSTISTLKAAAELRSKPGWRYGLNVPVPAETVLALVAVVEAAANLDEASRNPNWSGWDKPNGWDDAFDDLAEAIAGLSNSRRA